MFVTSQTNERKRKGNKKIIKSYKERLKFEDPPLLLHPNENQNHSNFYSKIFKSRYNQNYTLHKK